MLYNKTYFKQFLINKMETFTQNSENMILESYFFNMFFSSHLQYKYIKLIVFFIPFFNKKAVVPKKVVLVNLLKTFLFSS